MQSLLIYDIPDDRAHQKIADACLDYGLQRIQYSAFMDRRGASDARVSNHKNLRAETAACTACGGSEGRRKETQHIGYARRRFRLPIAKNAA